MNQSINNNLILYLSFFQNTTLEKNDTEWRTSPHHGTPTPRMQMIEEMENALQTNTTSIPDMNSTMNYGNMTEARAEVNDESGGNGTDRKNKFPVSTIVRKRPTYIMYNACIKLCTNYLPTICSQSAPPSFPPPPPPPPPFNCT